MKPTQAGSYGHLVVAGSSVYVYREKLRHWTGPHVVADVDAKRVDVHPVERTRPRSFHLSKLKPATLPLPSANLLHQSLGGKGIFLHGLDRDYSCR